VEDLPEDEMVLCRMTFAADIQVSLFVSRVDLQNQDHLREVLEQAIGMQYDTSLGELILQIAGLDLGSGIESCVFPRTETRAGMERLVDFQSEQIAKPEDFFRVDDSEPEEELCSEPLGNGKECNAVVTQADPYFATPCGTFCEKHMREHVLDCGICANQFSELVEGPAQA
jgi:hypothetical protein